MKFCPSCGASRSEGQAFCSVCGHAFDSSGSPTFTTPPQQQYYGHPTKKDNARTLGIISLFVWVVPLAGWIVAGIGLSRTKIYPNRTNVILNVIGLILATVMFIININMIL